MLDVEGGGALHARDLRVAVTPPQAQPGPDVGHAHLAVARVDLGAARDPLDRDVVEGRDHVRARDPGDRDAPVIVANGDRGRRAAPARRGASRSPCPGPAPGPSRLVVTRTCPPSPSSRRSTRPANARALSSVGRKTTLRSVTFTTPGAPAVTSTRPKAFRTSTLGRLPGGRRERALPGLLEGVRRPVEATARSRGSPPGRSTRDRGRSRPSPRSRRRRGGRSGNRSCGRSPQDLRDERRTRKSTSSRTPHRTSERGHHVRSDRQQLEAPDVREGPQDAEGHQADPERQPLGAKGWAAHRRTPGLALLAPRRRRTTRRRAIRRLGHQRARRSRSSQPTLLKRTRTPMSRERRAPHRRLDAARPRPAAPVPPRKRALTVVAPFQASMMLKRYTNGMQNAKGNSCPLAVR